MNIFDITASALTAQRMRMDVISSNLANANTTRHEDGSIGAYKRKNVIFTPLYNDAVSRRGSGGGSAMAGSLGLNPGSGGFGVGPDGRPLLTIGIRQSQEGGMGVQVQQITDDTTNPMRMVYDPSHPDANTDGYVEMPNVNVVNEMVDMISASRAYEANVTAMQSAKSMMQSAIDM